MLRISQAPESSAWHRKVAVKGRNYLATHPDTPASRLPDYWNDCRDDFYDAYHGICAYTATKIIKEHGFQMDHFQPKGDPQYKSLAYEWSNFRLAAPSPNLMKRTKAIADPFTVPDNACQIDFLKGRITLDPALPDSERNPLVDTIRVLNLNKGASLATRVRVFRQYRQYVMNRSGKTCAPQRDCIDVEHLTRWYPFVASEMLRLGKIEPEDRAVCRQILAELGFAAFKKSTSPSVALPGNASRTPPPSPPPTLQNPPSSPQP